MDNVKQVIIAIITFMLVIAVFMIAGRLTAGIDSWFKPLATIALGSIGGGAVMALMNALAKPTSRKDSARDAGRR